MQKKQPSSRQQIAEELIKTPKFRQKFAEELMARILKSFIDSGDVDPRNKSREELIAEVLGILNRVELIGIIDHTDNLLSQARNFRRAGDKEIACLFYALWTEHTLNSFTALLAERKRMSAKEIESMIRETSYKAKCSWLLRALGIRAISSVHANKINKLMDLRNSFVHYKWKPKSEESDKEMGAILESIEKTVRHLRYFENRYLATIPQKRAKKLLQKHSK